MKKVFGIIVDILTFSVFLVLVLIIFSRVKMMVSGKEYFDVFGYSVFNVATGSMEPAISQNDIIIVKEQDSYELNDIVTFKSDNAYVTHRVIAKTGSNLVTKGDANNAKDVSIKQNDVIGKVVKVIRQGGLWQQMFTSPTIIIMIFVTLMLFDFAFSYRGSKEEEKEKKSIFKRKPKVEKIEVEEVKEIKEVEKEIKEVEKEIKEVKEEIKEEIKEEKKEVKKEKKKLDLKKKLDEKISKLKEKSLEEKKKREESKKKKEEVVEEKEEKNKEEKPKLSDKEIVELYRKSELEKELNTDEDDDDPFGYTVRLDLSELQKRINEKMNEDKDE